MAIVLKSKDNQASQPSGLAGFNMSDLADQAQQQLANSQQQVQQMLADAQVEAARIRQSAKKEGYAEGYAQASRDIETQIADAAEQRARTGLDMVRDTVDQMQSAHSEWMIQYSDALAAVVLSAVERIVKAELKKDPEILVRWAQAAVQSTRTACELTVAINPETLAQLGQAMADMLSSADLPENTRIVADESVGPTEVAVRQTGGEISAGLMSQLDKLEQLFQ